MMDRCGNSDRTMLRVTVGPGTEKFMESLGSVGKVLPTSAVCTNFFQLVQPKQLVDVVQSCSVLAPARSGGERAQIGQGEGPDKSSMA